MGAVQSLTASFMTTRSFSVDRTDIQMSCAEVLPRVGEYVADYSALSAEEIATPIKDVDDLLARSKVISVKRGL